MKVLLFGGTSEGRELTRLLADHGADVLVSVATPRGLQDFFVDDPAVSFHCGAFSHEEKVAQMKACDWVVDATHPYAQSISPHVRLAAKEAQVAYLRVVRPQGDTQGCVVAESLEQAISLIPARGNVLSTTGAKEIAHYASMPNYQQRLIARVLDDEASVRRCLDMGIPYEHILPGRGPFTTADNIDVLQTWDIKTLVTKETGSAGGYPEKLEAARTCGVAVIVVARPVEADGISVQQAFSAMFGSH